MFPFQGRAAQIQRAVDGIFSGQAAVLTFFILSGYVLGLSLSGQRTFGARGYLQFMIKRVCRIMIPLAVIVLLSSCLVGAILWTVTGKTFVTADAVSHPSLMDGSYNRPLSLGGILQNIVLVRHDLDPVTWTITIEMIGSMLIPLFFRVNKTFIGRLLLLPTLVLLSTMSPQGDDGSWYYLYMFQLGLLIPFWGNPVISFLKRTRLLSVVFALAVFACVVNGHFGHNFRILAAALAFLLCHVIFSGQQWLAILDRQWIIWLGKVSYSFYLIHWPVVWLLAWAIFSSVPAFTQDHPAAGAAILLVVSVPLAALLADVSYNFVEVPAVQLARKARRNHAGTFGLDKLARADEG